MKSLRGKVAVVTGAASGIGRELALACGREGASVVLADVDEAGNRATAALLAAAGASTLEVRCDVADAARIERAVRAGKLSAAAVAGETIAAAPEVAP